MSQPSKTLWLGLGCRQNTSTALFQYAFEAMSYSYGLQTDAFIGIATSERKSAEAGLLEFSRLRGWSILFLAAADLARCRVPNPSKKAQSAVSLPSVAEAAALTAAGGGVGSFPPVHLLVPKQSFQLPQQYGAVTLAVAQSNLSA